MIIAQRIWFASLIKHGETMDMFFEPTQVGVTKFFWHFGIALTEVGICSYLAYLLRVQTLRDAWRRIQLDGSRAMLQESSRRMRAILDNVPDHAWVKDAHGRFVAVNAALARALRRAPEDIVGKMDEELFPGHLAAKYQDDDRAVMAGRTSQRFEERLADARGREFDVETIKTPIFDAAGDVAGTTESRATSPTGSARSVSGNCSKLKCETPRSSKASASSPAASPTTSTICSWASLATRISRGSSWPLNHRH